MSAERICQATNLHSRDAMKYIHKLVACGFIDSCTTSIDKRRIHVWGINYKKIFNMMYDRLTKIRDKLEKQINKTDMVYCATCDQHFPFEDALDDEFIVCCPNNKEHHIKTAYKISENNIFLVKDLINCIEELKNKTPKYCYSCHLNLSRVGDDCAI